MTVEEMDVDIQPAMIAKLQRHLQEMGVTNVETRVASAYELPVDEATVDRAFLVTVLAEIPDPLTTPNTPLHTRLTLLKQPAHKTTFDKTQAVC